MFFFVFFSQGNPLKEYTLENLTYDLNGVEDEFPLEKASWRWPILIFGSVVENTSSRWLFQRFCVFIKFIPENYDPIWGAYTLED